MKRKKRRDEILTNIVCVLTAAVFVWGIASWLEVYCHNLESGYEYNKGNMFVLLTKNLEEVKAQTTEKRFEQKKAAAVEDKEEIKVVEATEDPKESNVYSRDWGEEDSYLLAKIAMAEAEDQDMEGKALVICVVLNRVWNDTFPGTIRDVIFEKNQFSPILDGRWDRVEPNEDCYKALEMVEQGWDESQGATYFEVTQSQSTWHSRNLQKLFEHQDTSFYKE